jgi:hypothetical protein
MSKLDDSVPPRALDESDPARSGLSELMSQGAALATGAAAERGTPTESTDFANVAPACDSPATTRLTLVDTNPLQVPEAVAAAPAVPPSFASIGRAAPVARAANAAAPSGSSPFVASQIAGLAFMTLGVLIAAAPHFSPRAAEVLERFGDVRLHSGTLIVGGLLLFLVSLVRATLREIRGTVGAVSNETARLQEIAIDSHSVRETLGTVRSENTALSQDVVQLQVSLKQLIDIVSKPDYTVSIFRLAASVDQLGKHVDIYLKQQFAMVQQRLGSIAEHGEQSARKLASALQQAQRLAREIHESQAQSVRAGFDAQREAGEKTDARIVQSLGAAARVEVMLLAQQQAVADGFAGVAEHAATGASQLAAELDELRQRLERSVADQAVGLRAGLETLGERVDLAERGRSFGFEQFTQQVRDQLAGQADALRHGLNEIDSHVDQRTVAQRAALDEARAEAREASLAAKRDFAKGFEKTERQQASALEQLGQQFRSQLSGQADSLGKGLKELADLHALRHRELAAELEALGSRVEQQSVGQHTALQQVREQALVATGAARVELLDRLEQLGSRIEASVAAKHAAAEANALAIVGLFNSVSNELRASIAESVTRLDAATADCAAPIAAEDEAAERLPYSDPFDMPAFGCGDAECAADPSAETAFFARPETEYGAPVDSTEAGPEYRATEDAEFGSGVAEPAPESHEGEDRQPSDGSHWNY